MEHSAHAHLLPHGRVDSSGKSLASTYVSCNNKSPTIASQQQNETQQTRRLRLRNAGFRGPIFPFRRISPLFGAAPIALEPFSQPVNKESSPASPEKGRIYGEDLRCKSVNILQEVQNSTSRKRASPKPSFFTIFEDLTGEEGVIDTASPTSWYKDGSSNCSPATLPVSPTNMMKIREASLSPRTPQPLSSPLPKHVKARILHRSNIRSMSSETSMYIDHLESQLASANARLESPTTTMKRSAKLRALTVENRNLRHEISDWEKEFDARLQEEREQRWEVDMELRQQVRQLEEEMESKDTRIRELKWELESMGAKFRDAEDLEAINVSLEKRIEVLSNILVQLPMKLEVCSAATSPNKIDPARQTPRPRSLLPRLPSSSGGTHLSLATVSECAFWQSKTFGTISSPEDSPAGPGAVPLDEQRFSSPIFDEAIRSPGVARHSRLGSRASTSFRSAPPITSRSSSIRSSASFGPGSWGLPDQADIEPRSASRKRRSMRRFPSGSNSLRPLILPTATVVTSLPASAPVYPSIETTARWETSDISSDPTTTFPSRPAHSPPIATPTQPNRQCSATWVQEQTLRALEGKYSEKEGCDSACVSRPPPSVAGEPFQEFGEVNSEKRTRRSRPRSLQEELEEAHLNQLRATQAQEAFTKAFINVLPSEDSKENSDHIMMGIEPMTSQTHVQNVSLRQRRPGMDINETPKPDKKHPSSSFTTSPQDIKSLFPSPLTPEHAHGILYRLANVITRTKQDPSVLARRLLAKAWALGSERLGGIGWWLLGLVFRTRKRKRKRTADSGVVEDDSKKAFNWQHLTAEASRGRMAEHYFSVNGSTHARIPRFAPSHTFETNLYACQNIPPTTSYPRNEPHLFPCSDCVEPSSRRTFRLWFQFSLAIVLAVGLAIKNGPGTLLVGNPHPHKNGLAPLKTEQEGEHQLEHADEVSQPSRRSHESNGMDSGYGSITFAEILGPDDFEDH